jgi:acyl-[acyl-carrier-protein] desaturase
MVDDRALLAALTPRLHELVERHLETTKEWFPHELVPWSQGRDWGAEGSWSPDDTVVPAEVRSALFVNLLTEDNLPHYFETINRVFGDEAWRVWARRWTAEEMRHSTVIRDYATVTRALDPVALERARMSQVAGGIVPQPTAVLDGLAYVALQELATRVAHRNTGKLLDDPVGYEIMARVGADENLHYLLYRDLVSAALELDPSATVEAIERQVRDFEMPGTGIPSFTRHAAAIARAGIYDLPTHHEQIIVPVVVRHWKVDRLEGLTPDGEAARTRLLDFVERIGTMARKQAERRERRREAALSRA